MEVGVNGAESTVFRGTLASRSCVTRILGSGEESFHSPAEPASEVGLGILQGLSDPTQIKGVVFLCEAPFQWCIQEEAIKYPAFQQDP